MGKGYVSRFSLHTIRLIVAGLLAMMLIVSGVTVSDDSLISAPPAVMAGEPGGSTGGG